MGTRLRVPNLVKLTYLNFLALRKDLNKIRVFFIIPGVPISEEK